MASEELSKLKSKIKEAVLDQKILIQAREEAKEQFKRDRPRPELIIRKASEVPDEPLVTCFGGRLVAAAFQLLVGPGEAGKGMASVDIIAKMTRGTPFPGETNRREPINVMVCVTEDAAARVKARLQAANADLDRAFFVDGPPAMRGGLIVPSPVAFDDDAGVIVENARKLEIKALFLETMVEHLGDRDGHQPSTNNEAEVRRALSPVIAACREARLIGWGVMHPRKSMEGGIEDSISGSAGFRNVARNALHIYPDPTDESEDRWRLLISTKANYLARRPSTLRFRVESDPNNPAEGRVIWGRGNNLVDPRRAEDVWREMQEKMTRRNRRDHSVVEAEAFLADLLKNGQRLGANEIKAAAREAGIDWRSVERAKAKLRIHAIKDGFQGKFVWELPAEDEGM